MVTIIKSENALGAVLPGIDNIAIFDIVGNTVDSGVPINTVIVISGEVDTYDDLPPAALHLNEIWKVDNPTSGHIAGLYQSNGTTWVLYSSIPTSGTPPINYNTTTGIISLDYNTTNLKLTDGALNTIQDIDILATPNFAGISIANESFFNSEVIIGGLTDIAFKQKLTVTGEDSSLLGPHKITYTSIDDFPITHDVDWTHNNISRNFDCYYDGSAYRSSHAGSNFQLAKVANKIQFNVANDVAQGDPIIFTEAGLIDLASGVLAWQKQAKFYDTTESTSTITGCATFLGGVGIDKNVFIGGNANIASLTPNALVYADSTKKLASLNLGTGLSFDSGTGTLSATGLTPGQLTLNSGQIIVGNVSNIGAAVSMSGDATLDNTGAITIANSAVTNAKIANSTIDLATKVTGILPNVRTTAQEFNVAGNTPYSIASRDQYGELKANTANSAEYSNAVVITPDTTDTTAYLLFANNTGPSFQSPRTNTGLLYNAVTNAITATSFIGNASSSSTVSTANEATDTTCFPLFVTASGTQTLQPKNNANLTFNSSNGKLGASSLNLSAITASTLTYANSSKDIASVAAAGSANQLLISNASNVAAWTSRYIDYGSTVGNLFAGTLCGNASITNNPFNTGFGVESLKSIAAATSAGKNSAFGFKALWNLTLGSENTAVGYNSAITLTSTSSSNSIFGASAGDAYVLMNQCTLIGAHTEVGDNDLTNATALGYGAIEGESNSITLGNSSVTKVKTSGTIITSGGGTFAENVGVGITNPNFKLQVVGGQIASTDSSPAISQKQFLFQYNTVNDRGEITCIHQGSALKNILLNGANVLINPAAIATNATNGFLKIPTCAGTPTGIPSQGNGSMVMDTTNNRLYIYSSGAWRAAM